MEIVQRFTERLLDSPFGTARNIHASGRAATIAAPK